ncbi:Imm70 family immunity protein [Sulfurovum mangrovi]|uniref:Imm70 family immunity protein n=1 Tax=Sulfurovum mangrovi TaxID=2893889 RepID=UPI001E58067B|nr:Imm70 family immunity protein [Sulfurovum mangrovi]UFH59486.1 immunity 70 family protein [Sulfurovum mangrovi]
MIVGFKIFGTWIEFGYSETLYSWFSTICYKLEDGKWGSRFPIVMNHLYFDEEAGVNYEQIEKFREEIITIKNEFSKLAPADAVWSFEDNILEIPKNMPNINYNTDNLQNFYISNSGQTIFERLEYTIEGMAFYKSNCSIEAEKDI